MKTIILIILIFFSCFTIKAQCGVGYDYDFRNITDLEKRDLNGAVASIIYTHYTVIDNFGK